MNLEIERKFLVRDARWRDGATGRERLRQLASQVISAQEDERRRVSRELHDDVGQRLSLMSIELETLLNQDSSLS